MTELVEKFSDWVSSKIPSSASKNRMKQKINSIKKNIIRAFNSFDRFRPRLVRRELKGTFESYRIRGEKEFDFKTFAAKKIIPKTTNLLRKQKKPKKISEVAQIEFSKTNEITGAIEYLELYFRSDNTILHEDLDIAEYLNRVVEKMEEDIVTFVNNGSEWVFQRVIYFDDIIATYQSAKGSSYFPLPKFLKNKYIITNVNNKEDNECLKWAITSAVFPRKKDPQRLTESQSQLR